MGAGCSPGRTSCICPASPRRSASAPPMRRWRRPRRRGRKASRSPSTAITGPSSGRAGRPSRRRILRPLVEKADILFGNHRDISLLLGRDFSGDRRGAAARGGRGGFRGLSATPPDRLHRAPRHRRRHPSHRGADRRPRRRRADRRGRGGGDRRPDRRRRRLRGGRPPRHAGRARSRRHRPCRARAELPQTFACPAMPACSARATSRRSSPASWTCGAEMLHRRAFLGAAAGLVAMPGFGGGRAPSPSTAATGPRARRPRGRSRDLSRHSLWRRANVSRRPSPPPPAPRSMRALTARPRRNRVCRASPRARIACSSTSGPRKRIAAPAARSWSISTAALIRRGTANSPLLDGRHLAAQADVVVVTVQHRLNAFGYLYLARLDPRFPDSGNAGQLDLILALRWVRDNIAGLRRRSRQGHRLRPVGRRRQDRDVDGHARRRRPLPSRRDDERPAGHRLRARSTPPGATRAFMAAARRPLGRRRCSPCRPSGWSKGWRRATRFSAARVYFGPVLDMNWLTRHPFWPDANPQSNAIPLLLGNTRDETRAFYPPGHRAARRASTGTISPSGSAPELRIDAHPEWVVAEYRRRCSRPSTPNRSSSPRPRRGGAGARRSSRPKMRAQAGVPPSSISSIFPRPRRTGPISRSSSGPSATRGPRRSARR